MPKPLTAALRQFDPRLPKWINSRHPDARARLLRPRQCPRLVAHLRRWHRLNPEAQHFVEFMDNLCRPFKTAVGLAGITRQVSPHTPAATWLMQRGSDPWRAAGYLGMSLDVLLNTSGHHHPDYLSDAIDKITRRETKARRSEIVSEVVAVAVSGFARPVSW